MAKKTTAVFAAEVSDTTNEEYMLVGEYTNNKTKTNIYHTICGSTYLVAPKSFLGGNRCPVCRNKTRGAKRKTQEDFVKQVQSLTGSEYKVTGEYTGVYNKVELLHLPCGVTWSVTPNKFISTGSRCPSCAREQSRLAQTTTTEEFIDKLNLKYLGEYNVLGEYQGSKIKLLVEHVPCGHKWHIKPSHLTTNNMCPNCKLSKGERLVKDYLTSRNLEFEEQKTFRGLRGTRSLSYDFYLPASKLVIEYQGIQHYEPVDTFGGTARFEAQRRNDEIKREYAKHNGMTLIEVHYAYNSFDKIEVYLDKVLNL